MSVTTRIIAAILLAVSFPSAALADLTFSGWAKGPPDGRAIYVAGVLETVGVYAEIFGYVDQLAHCLQEKQISYGAFSEAIVDFAKRRPELQDQPAPGVMMIYLNELCGFDLARRKSP